MAFENTQTNSVKYVGEGVVELLENSSNCTGV